MSSNISATSLAFFVFKGLLALYQEATSITFRVYKVYSDTLCREAEKANPLDAPCSPLLRNNEDDRCALEEVCELSTALASLTRLSPL